MSTGTPKSGPRLVTRSLAYLPKTVARPRRTAQELLAEETIHPSLIVVLGFALLESLLFLISYLAGDYPPPAGELRTWIEAWGEFAMLPFTLRGEYGTFAKSAAAAFPPCTWVSTAWAASTTPSSRAREKGIRFQRR